MQNFDLAYNTLFILFPGKKRISDKHPMFQERKNVRLFGVMTKTSVSSDKNVPLLNKLKLLRGGP